MRLFIIIIFILILGGGGCTFKMNLTGGKPDPNLKTLSVLPITNEAPLVIAYHSQRFTEQLRDKFLTQSRLSMVNANGDIELSGSIMDYSIRPVAVSGSTASQNRMTISVKIKYTNKINPSENWENTFSSFTDIPASTSLSASEQSFIEKVNEQIAQDIFNKSLGKW